MKLNWFKDRRSGFKVWWSNFDFVLFFSPLFIFVIFGGLIAGIGYLGHSLYQESQRTGTITCVSDIGNLKLPFTGGMWQADGVFSFYSPRVDQDLRLNLDCVVVYDD